MPWKSFKENNQYCVYKIDAEDNKTGKSLGCHSTMSQADKQVAALYASEGKEADAETKEEAHEKMYDEMGHEMNYSGPISFTEMQAEREAREQAYKVQEMAYEFPMMVKRIMSRPDVEDKEAALSTLSKEFIEMTTETLAKEGQWTASQVKADKGEKAEEKNAPEDIAESGLYIWKDADTGQYKWIAAYSNNYRDDDDPPEIISAQSHKEFDQVLEKGEYPMPELWLWHVDYPVGQTLYHTYSEETGFPVAGGVFYDGMEWAAEGLIKAGWDGVSHGMPITEIERNDPDDPTIITRHRTKEISFLPLWAAANKLSFNIISKESDMSDKELPARKRPEWLEAFGEERVKQVEEALDDKAKEAQDMGLENKDKDQEQPTEAATPEPEQEQKDEAPLTRKEIFDALLMQQKQIEQLTKAVSDLAAAKQAEEEEPDLVSLLKEHSAIGKKETQVDGRTSLAKDGPSEADPDGPSVHPIPFIDRVMKMNQKAAGWNR